MEPNLARKFKCWSNYLSFNQSRHRLTRNSYAREFCSHENANRKKLVFFRPFTKIYRPTPDGLRNHECKISGRIYSSSVGGVIVHLLSWLLEVNFPYHRVRWSVGLYVSWSVCHNFCHMGQEVSFSSSYQSTCWYVYALKIFIFILCYLCLNLMYCKLKFDPK